MRSYLRDVMIFGGVVPIHQFYWWFYFVNGEHVHYKSKTEKET